MPDLCITLYYIFITLYKETITIYTPLISTVTTELLIYNMNYLPYPE